MSTVNLRLDRLPGQLEGVRKFAPRSDGFDSLPAQIMRLGFAPDATVGAIVENVDLDALRLTVGGLPAGVSRVERIALNRSFVTGLPSSARDLLGREVGVPTWVAAEAAQWAISFGVATAA